MTDNILNLQAVIKDCNLNVVDENTVFGIAYTLVGNTSVFKNNYATTHAGYDVYTSEDGEVSFCNLGNRLEVNFEDATSKNIWFNN